MVESIYRGAVRPRNRASRHQLAADPLRQRAGEMSLRHPDLIDHPFVTPDDQLRLVAAVEDHAKIAIGDLVRAVPDHPAPVSAIMVLVDAGLLALDFSAPLDAATQVWRPSSRERC